VKWLTGAIAATLLASGLGAALASPAAADATPSAASSTATDPPPAAGAASPEPTLAVDCQSLTLHVAADARVRLAATATDPEAGLPNDPRGGRAASEATYEYPFPNPGWAWNWTAEAWSSDGTYWSRSGTTTPCHGFTKGYVRPVVPPALTVCGATLDQIVFASTRHVTYWHDATTAYATADPDWMWAEGSLGPPHAGWIPPDNVPSNKAQTVHIDGYDLLHPPVGCTHTVPGPYDSPPARPRQSPSAVATPPAPDSTPSTASAPASPPSSTPAPTPSTAPSPSPDPPPPTATRARSQRLTTGAGLGIAGGVGGGCAVLAAGALVVRRRLHATPGQQTEDGADHDAA